MSYTDGQVFSPAALTRLATALGGVPILGCVEGSPAHVAGVRYGDIVLAIDGTPTASWTDFFQARRRSPTQLSVRVLRQGTPLEISMTLPATARTPRHVLDRPLASYPREPVAHTR